MANDEPQVDDILVDDPADELGDDPSEETTDWKAEAEKARGIAKRNKTKLEKARLKLKDTEAVNKALADKSGDSNKNKGFDYAEKAYLKSSGIAPSEFDLVKEVMDATGKSLDEVLESRHFQGELKERREAQASKDAVPSGTRRSANPTRDSVDYWLAKGEMPPADQPELRRKYVNAKAKASQGGSNFTDRPVA